MTNEKAIEVLTNHRRFVFEDSEEDIAIVMAISALEEKQTNTAEFRISNAVSQIESAEKLKAELTAVIQRYVDKHEKTNTAEWIIPDLVTGRYKCSHCRGNANKTTRFCPYCGYLMSNYNGKAE